MILPVWAPGSQEPVRTMKPWQEKSGRDRIFYLAVIQILNLTCDGRQEEAKDSHHIMAFYDIVLDLSSNNPFPQEVLDGLMIQ